MYSAVLAPAARDTAGLDLEQQEKLEILEERLRQEAHAYLIQHPELRQVLNDFMSSILLHRPDDVYVFARDFFEAFKDDENVDDFDEKDLFTQAAVMGAKLEKGAGAKDGDAGDGGGEVKSPVRTARGDGEEGEGAQAELGGGVEEAPREGAQGETEAQADENVEAPAEEAPTKADGAPLEEVDAGPDAIEAPTDAIEEAPAAEGPAGTAEVPAKIEAPTDAGEVPVDDEAPTDIAEAPADTAEGLEAEAPADTAEAPTVEAPTDTIEAPAAEAPEGVSETPAAEATPTEATD